MKVIILNNGLNFFFVRACAAGSALGTVVVGPLTGLAEGIILLERRCYKVGRFDCHGCLTDRVSTFLGFTRFKEYNV